MKLAIVFVLTALAAANAKEICAGCPVKLDFKEAKNILDAQLAKLPEVGGPYYKSGEIHSATQQIVAGIMYNINVDLIGADQKVEACDVTIVNVPWENSTELTIECPNQEKVVKELH